MNHYTSKAIAAIAAAIPCSVLIHYTGGDHGIGWFILALLIIW